MTVNILGTEYEIIEATAAEDAMLEKCDGYCDKTVKTIVISKKAKDCDLKDFSVYQKKVMRHEIIHASGAAEALRPLPHPARRQRRRAHLQLRKNIRGGERCVC